jgi:hypothetical protein
MSNDDHTFLHWDAFPFDEEITFATIPDGAKTSAMYVSVTAERGGVRILGRMANGGIGSVTFSGKVYAAKLPFADRVVRLQYLGNTRSVGLELTSYQQ